MFTKTLTTFALASVFFFSGIGCVTAGSKHVSRAADRVDQDAKNRQAYFEPEDSPLDPKAEEENTGSLWVSSYSSHIYDNMYKARRLGDTITIIIDERSQGFNKGDTKSDKKTEHSAGIDSLFGILTKLQGLIPVLNPASLVDAKTESKFKADAETQREGELTAKLTATVSRVLKNGNLLLRGEKRIKVNKEEQILVVEGIIRPYDILPDNTVLSTSLADTRISYTGFGIVAERQSPGWLVRALDYIWPF